MLVIFSNNLEKFEMSLKHTLSFWCYLREDLKKTEKKFSELGQKGGWVVSPNHNFYTG